MQPFQVVGWLLEIYTKFSRSWQLAEWFIRRIPYTRIPEEKIKYKERNHPPDRMGYITHNRHNKGNIFEFSTSKWKRKTSILRARELFKQFYFHFLWLVFFIKKKIFRSSPTWFCYWMELWWGIYCRTVRWQKKYVLLV